MRRAAFRISVLEGLARDTAQKRLVQTTRKKAIIARRMGREFSIMRLDLL
jgi:hypothetical protein